MDTVLLKKIQPDPDQPRKLFAADKMHQLTESIKREGIITPLVVEKIGDNYLLIDGERRFRAATALGLKEVPVIVEDTRNATERKLRQFAVQEQHEAWTPIEKALALDNLAGELGLNLGEVCTLLNISPSNTLKYIAFSRLADKEGYIKSEIPLDFTTYIASLRNTAKAVVSTQLNAEFTKSDEKKLERKVVQNIKDGVIENRTDITKLSYAFRKNPKMVEKYLSNVNSTPEGLFLESGAQGVRALQNVRYNAGFFTSHVNKFMTIQDVEVPRAIVLTVKATVEAGKKFLARYEE